MLLGIDLSTHHTSVVLANQYGQSELALRSELPRGGGSPEGWGAVVATAREVLRRATIEPSGVASTVISFPAPLNERGVVLKDSRAPGWDGVDLPQAAREHLGLHRVVAENRTICQARGEAAYGALRPADGAPAAGAAGQSWHYSQSWLYVHIDRHVDGVACLDGQIRRGAHLAAMDLGAVCVERNGVLCANGRHGCLEGYCGGDAFLERARSYGIQLATPADVWQQAESNFAAKSLCEDYVSRLAQGLGIAITLLDPARLVVGGSLPAALGEKLLTPLRQGLRDFCPSRPYQNLQLAAAQLGQDAAALGAIALAHENNSISVNP